MQRRRTQKPSGLRGVASGLMGGLGKRGSSSSSGSRAKTGAGLAVVSAVAGLAISNRDKIGKLVSRSKDADAGTMPPPTTPAPAGTYGDTYPPPAADLATPPDPLRPSTGADPLDRGEEPPTPGA